ncbi:MAG: DUF1566 domain-containing protein [Desulfobacteraceae bacterium]|nr:DUF1566 domain-containing protein [Desulfobacteraceae bacterium]
MNFLIKIPLIKILVIISVFFQASMVYAISIPQTGQTTCYDETGAVISCANTGQDGDIQAGVVWPVNRFTDNGDGTLTDALTGLVWMQNANLAQTAGASTDGRLIWQEALDFVKDLNNGVYPPHHAGYTDWRLPNLIELESLINHEEIDFSAWLNTQGFTGFISFIYWSSTTRVQPGQETDALAIATGSGIQTAQDKATMEMNLIMVRGISNGPSVLHRTGQQTCYDATGTVISCAGTGQDGELQTGAAWPVPRFTDMGEGTIKDELTGLLWLKDIECLGPQNWMNTFTLTQDFNTNPGSYSCSEYTADYDDWRVPNRRELASLHDFSQYNPSLPADHLFVPISWGYDVWSSTTLPGSPHLAYTARLLSPTIYIASKTGNNRAWLVRDADPDCEPVVNVMQVWSEDSSGIFNVDFMITDNLTTNSAVTIAGCNADTYKLVIKYHVFDGNGVKFLIGKEIFLSVGTGTYSSNFTAAFPAGFAMGQSKIQVKGKLYFDGTILTTDKHHGWIDVE